MLSSVRGTSDPIDDNLTSSVTRRSMSSSLQSEAMVCSKQELRVVSLPLLLLGIPTHLFFLNQPMRSEDSKAWMTSIAHLPHLFLPAVTLIFFLLCLSVDVYILYNIFQTLNLLLINGQLDWLIVEVFLELVLCFPILIALNLIWVKGYFLRSIAQALTFPTPTSASFVINPRVYPLFDDKHHQSPNHKGFNLNIKKLIGLYGAITLVHVTHLVLYAIRIRENLVGRESIGRHCINYLLGPVFTTLLLPVYAAFCWACQRQYQLINIYLRHLTNTTTIQEISQLNEFKVAFRELADRIQLVNQVFESYFSYVVSWILFSLTSVEVMDIQSIARMPTNDYLNLGGGADRKIQFDMIRIKRQEMVVQRIGGDGMIGENELVRLLTIASIALLVKIGVTWYSIWQVVGVNQEARNLNLRLNDLVTESAVHVTQDTYNAFRLLKYYVHSRLQEPRPALLRMSVPLPFLQSRLEPIPIGQYD